MRCALAIVAAALAGCGGAASRWIDDAASAHARADALAGGGDRESAIRVLEQVVAQPAPGRGSEQDRRTVRQDAYLRLADLALAAGDPARALRYADAGLALGEGRDVFTSSLRTFRGRAHEALGRDADAARDYEAAQIVAEALLQAALTDGGPR
jgi:tetratricopeptide (TPR) repeat protein